MKLTKIDVHHHIFPQEYVDALKSAGLTKTFGHEFPKWTVDTSLNKMKENGIKIAMLSISTPGVYSNKIDVPEGFSEELARSMNEIIAKTKEQYPDRFGGFATIPLLNPDAAIDELNYALDTLKLDGVCLLTNYKGKYLGDKFFEPFFKELNRRKTVVFVHPTDPGDDFNFGLDIPNALVEAPFDTTRAVANMMFNGVLDKYPDIRYILSHGGGTIPYIAWRLAGIEYGQKDKPISTLRALYDYLVNREPTKGLNHLRNMYYDTAHVSGDSAVRTLLSFVKPDHVVFGTDLCISKLATVVTKNLKKDGDFTEEQYRKMSYGNSLDLFPGMKKKFDE